MFWTIASILTLVAILAVAVPLLRKPTTVDSALDHDREVYRARLAEIETDEKLGRLTAEEVQAARAEEGRRLITLSDHPGHNALTQRSPLATFLLVAAVSGIPAVSVLTYYAWGKPDMADMAIATRANENPADQTLTQLLERAEAQLARQPDDVRGWRVVAPVYLRLGRVEDAITAWRNASRLEPDDLELRTSLAETMVVGASGVVTEQARRLFSQVLETNPRDAKSRFYLAIALGQQGADNEAIEAWQSLIADAPANAPWLQVARAQLRQVADRAGIELAEQEPASGPTSEDIEAASQLSAEDRTAMIEGMVSGLADKLEEDPQDKQGWRRLITSYRVLQKSEEARSAITTARTHFAGDAAFLAELAQLEQELGGNSPETTQ